MTLSGWRWLLVPLALVVGSGWGAMVARWKEPASRPAPAPVLPRPETAEDEPEPDPPTPPAPPLPSDFFRLPVADPKDGPVPAPVRVGQIVQIEVLETLPGRPLTGERIVRSDGTISLGFYGDLPVAGLDRRQIKVRLIERLHEFINDDVLGLVRQDVQTGRVELVPPLWSNRVFVDDESRFLASPQPPPDEAAALRGWLDALEGEVRALHPARPEAAAAPADAPK